MSHEEGEIGIVEFVLETIWFFCWMLVIFGWMYILLAKTSCHFAHIFATSLESPYCQMMMQLKTPEQNHLEEIEMNKKIERGEAIEIGNTSQPFKKFFQ